jgi:hypothetical protein
MMHYCVFDTAFGPCGVAWSERGLRRLHLPERDHGTTERWLARNPVPVVIPCHRVLANRHRIGGFSPPGGTFTKERLLALEGVRIEAGTPPLPGSFEGGR